MLPLTSKNICWLCLYLNQTSNPIIIMTAKAAPKLAAKTTVKWWRCVPESDWARKKTKNTSIHTCHQSVMEKTARHKKKNAYIPFRASGGKDNGSGKTAEQLFAAFRPQIKGLPTILKWKEKIKLGTQQNYTQK